MVVSESTSVAKTCKCCGGSGIQINKNGIKEYCPACGGSGVIYKRK